MCFLFLLEIENLQAAFYTGCHLGQGHNGRHTTTTGFDLTQFFATFFGIHGAPDYGVFQFHAGISNL